MKIIRFLKSLAPAVVVEVVIFLGLIIGLVLLYKGLGRAGVISAGEITAAVMLILLWLKHK